MKWLHLLLSSLALLLTSCLEDSTVIKVNKDGSGLVHHRQYSRNHTEAKDVKLPTKEEIAAIAKAMGPEVTVESAEKAHNPQGWYGYEIVYQFPDINKVTITPSSSQKSSSKKKDSPEGELSKLRLNFQMEDGVLQASFNLPEWDQPATAEAKENLQRGPTIDPYAQASKQRAQKVSITSGIGRQQEMLKAMSQGMRMGVFLQPGSPLKSTTALHLEGELITLMNADMEKIYQEGEPNLQVLEGKTREECVQLIEEIQGFDVDFQNPILFEFK